MVVRSITSSLDPGSRVTGKPHRLVTTAGIAFQGSNILGLGFIMEPERAHKMIEKDPRKQECPVPVPQRPRP